MTASSKKDQQAFRKGYHVIGPLPQGWNFNLNHIDPIVKILPEPAFPDGFLQIDVRRSDDSDIGMARHIIADSLILLLLDESQQLRLEG